MGEAIARVVGALKGAQQVPWLTDPCAGTEEGAGILTEGKGREGIIGRWKGKSKGLEIGKPWALLDKRKQCFMAGELEARWGGMGV